MLRVGNVLTSSFDWFIRLPVSLVIGQRDYISFGFTKLLYSLSCLLLGMLQ